MQREALRVLIVDDDEDYAFLLQDYLREKFIACRLFVYHAMSFDDALKVINSNGTFDLFIVDYLLNHINGIELVVEIRSRGLDAPIIFLTGYGNEEVAVSALKVGANDYLPKAKLTPELLAYSVHHAFEVVEYERQKRQYEEQLCKKTKELEELNRQLENRVSEEVKKNKEQEHMLILQNRLAAMGEMLSFIAHQWKQPLNAIGLIAQGLQEDCGSGDYTKEYVLGEINLIMEIIKHLSNTVDDFRSFIKTDTQCCQCKLSDVIKRIVNIIKPSFREKSIAIETEFIDDPEIYCMTNQLMHALINIINNARDALLERKVKSPKVTIVVDRYVEKARITIRDNAGGIDEQILNSIFEPYVTTKKEGSGIGLYMSRLLVEKNMNGRIYARNTEEGAEFVIEI